MCGEGGASTHAYALRAGPPGTPSSQPQDEGAWPQSRTAGPLPKTGTTGRGTGPPPSASSPQRRSGAAAVAPVLPVLVRPCTAASRPTTSCAAVLRVENVRSSVAQRLSLRGGGPRPLRTAVGRGSVRSSFRARGRDSSSSSSSSPALPRGRRTAGQGEERGGRRQARTRQGVVVKRFNVAFLFSLVCRRRQRSSCAASLPRLFSRPRTHLPVYVAGGARSGCGTLPAELSRRQAGFPAGGPLRLCEKRGRAETTSFPGKERRAVRRALRARTCSRASAAGKGALSMETSGGDRRSSSSSQSVRKGRD